jgi:hypothetical protein
MKATKEIYLDFWMSEYRHDRTVNQLVLPRLHPEKEFQETMRFHLAFELPLHSINRLNDGKNFIHL